MFDNACKCHRFNLVISTKSTVVRFCLICEEQTHFSFLQSSIFTSIVEMKYYFLDGSTYNTEVKLQSLPVKIKGQH